MHLWVFKGADSCFMYQEGTAGGRTPFTVWDVFYLSKRKKYHNDFSACFPAFLETIVIIKIKFNVDFSKTFFPLGNGMKTAGSLQVAMTFSHHRVNHTQRRNHVLWCLVSVTSPDLSSAFFFWTTNPPFLSSITEWQTHIWKQDIRFCRR